MNYHNYETAVVKMYGVRLVGWPDGMKFANPSTISTVPEARKLRDALRGGSCFWKKMSKSELEMFITDLDARRAAGETVRKPRKKRSDAGVPRKRKVPTGDRESGQPRKRMRTGLSTKRTLPKSIAFIPTSDEDDSADEAA